MKALVIHVSLDNVLDGSGGSASVIFRNHRTDLCLQCVGNAPVKQLATGFDWVEEPVWLGDANCLLLSDIPNNRIMRWSPDTGISTYRAPSNFANGHTRDRQRPLVSYEHGGHRVTRTETDGRIRLRRRRMICALRYALSRTPKILSQVLILFADRFANAAGGIGYRAKPPARRLT